MFHFRRKQSFRGLWLTLCMGLGSGILLATLNHNGPDTLLPAVTRPAHKYSNVSWSANRSVDLHMRNEIRILCWILTGPTNHLTKAQHIRHTWGRHCDTLLFMSTAEDPELANTIPLPVGEGRDFLWAKTRAAFQYVYDHHLDDADWFLKADDDTFVVIENLRYMLQPYTPETPIYFGRKFVSPAAREERLCYMSGGAGYVLSKRALTRLVEDGFTNASMCHEGDDHSEDMEMGNCMRRLDVVAADSRDGDSDRFFPFFLNYHVEFHPKDDFWYFDYCYYFPNDGEPGVTENAVSFHYISPSELHMYYYMIYVVQTYGRAHRAQIGPIDGRKITLDELKEALRLRDPIRASTTLAVAGTAIGNESEKES